MEIFKALQAVAADLLGRFKRWLTFRRVLGIVAILVLLLCLKGLIEMGMGADLPILFGLDWGIALEVSALMVLLSVRDRVAVVAYVVRSKMRSLRPASRLLRRGMRRAFRSRPAAPRLPAPPSDEPGLWALA